MQNFHGSGNYNNSDINIKNDPRGSIAHSPAATIATACICGLTLFCIVIVWHFSFNLLQTIVLVLVCGGACCICVYALSHIVRHVAVTAALVINASGERRRLGIFSPNPNQVLIDRAILPYVEVESVRQIQETHHYQEDGMLLPEQAESLIKAPPFRQILNTIERTARQNEKLPLRDKKWYIGHDMEGKPIIGKFYDVRACGFGGAQGQGKTSNMVNFAYQGHAYGFGLVVFDPHMNNEEGLVPRLASVRNSFVRPPVGEDGDAILDQFEWLQAQYEQRKRPGGMKNAKTLMVFADEWNELLRALRGDAVQRKQVIDIMLNLIQGGRKHGIFPFVAAQNWQNETVGGSDMRYGLPTRISHRNETPAMKMLLNCTERQLEELCIPPMQTLDAVISTANGALYRYCIPRPELEDGAACDEIRLRVKNGFPQVSMNRPSYSVSEVSEADTEADDAEDFQSASLDFQPDFRNTGKIIDFQPMQQPLDFAEADSVEADTGNANRNINKEIEQVMLMDMRGAKNEDIYREIYGITGGGRKYQQAAERLRKIRGIIAARHMKAARGE